MRIERRDLPGLPGVYAALLLRARRRQLAEDERLPPIELTVDTVGFEAERIRAYRSVCGFDPGEAVPISYPLVVTFPMQLALFGQREWPLHAAGLVHIGVDLEQHAPIRPGVSLRGLCALESQERTPRGHEFVLAVTLADPENGAAVWHARSRVLARGGGRARRRSDRADEELPPMSEVARFEAAADIGRRYARVAGDWNPIHLAWLGARAFGFQRPVAHGMWTLGRTLAACQEGEGRPGRTVAAEFRAPLYLPGQAGVHAEPPGSSRRFVVREFGVGRTVLAGTIGTPEA